ncbi:MAG: hypothetical protein ACXW2G_03075 [Burkholderiaceae bacterium]
MQPIDAGIAILVLHGLLGGFDTLYSHEWDARLPRKPYAARELKLHAGRSCCYVAIFGGLAWFEWHGAMLLVLALLAVGEFGLTLVDSVVEDRTRDVAATERVVHMMLGVTTGAWAGFVFYTGVNDWWSQPTALAGTAYGFVSWLLTFYAIAVAISATRDAVAAAHLDRQARFLCPEAVRPAAAR